LGFKCSNLAITIYCLILLVFSSLQPPTLNYQLILILHFEYSTMTCQNTPSILFGGASLGDSFTTPDAVQSVLSLLESHNIYRIDTAGRYPPINPGRSEQLLREAKATDQGFTIDTKILARVGDGSGELTREKIEESLKESLERLGVAKINILHIHRPDPQTPLDEQAAALDALYKEGKFAALGVSNFRPETLRAFLAVCEENAFIKPTVYQGDYSSSIEEWRSIFFRF
jgi:aflatoxin B1 aldehyde reductase